MNPKDRNYNLKEIFVRKILEIVKMEHSSSNLCEAASHFHYSLDKKELKKIKSEEKISKFESSVKRGVTMTIQSAPQPFIKLN